MKDLDRRHQSILLLKMIDTPMEATKGVGGHAISIDPVLEYWRTDSFAKKAMARLQGMTMEYRLH
jgi:hypothetical protein